MSTDALIGKVINRSKAIDKLLRKHYPAAKSGLHAAVKSLGDKLPAVLNRTINEVAHLNAAAHFDQIKVPADFDRLCDEIESLIPHFASQQHAKPPQSPKKPKPAPKLQATAAIPKPPNNGAASHVPANRGKPWTPEEDKKLADAFDAQTTIPELAKAHQRGVGGIQNRLSKLGKLTADQYKNYPLESQ